MIRKYQIVLKPIGQDGQEIDNNLELFNGQYFINQPSNVGVNKIVTKNTALNYLSNPNNQDVVSGFTQYLKNTLIDQETFEAIYYDSNRITPILNDYYRNAVLFNLSPNPQLLNDVLSGGTIVYSKNNNFDLITNNRLETQEKDVITVTEDDSYYIDIYMPRTSNDLQSGDYSKYVDDCVEDGVVLKNCFVNLNQKDDPFEFWNNDIKGSSVELESNSTQRLNLSGATNV